MAERVKRLEQAIGEAVKLASPEMQEVIRGLQALRGIAGISAVTIAAELGNISRFQSARQLMGYSGAVPAEDSSGKRTRRGSITKTGNAHLRRIAIEAAWSYRLRPAIGPGLRKRQEDVPDEIKEIAWKAQHRLHKRYAGWGRRARTNARSSPRWDANCWASSGPSESRRKRRASCGWRPEEKQEQKQRQKQKLSKE
jgi:transposase